MEITDSARIRLAVALVVLRYKPRHQSCAGCLLDLRTRFPVHPRCDDTQLGDGEPWREQAHLLEEEVRTLKRKAALESAELEALRATLPTPTQETPLAEPPSTGAQLKRKKKKPNPSSKEKIMPNSQSFNKFSELQATLCNLTTDIDLPALHDPLSVFNTYQKLLQISMKDRRSSDFLAGLSSSAVELLRAVGELLRAVLQPHRQAPKNASEIVEAIDAILDSVLSCVLEAVVESLTNSGNYEHYDSDSLLDAFWGSLTLDLLIPLTKSYAHLTRFMFTSIFQASKSTGKKATRPGAISSSSQPLPDILPAILALLKRVFAKLRDGNARILPRTGEILDFVALSAVTEISKLWMIDSKLIYTLSGGQNQGTAITVGLNNERSKQVDGRRPDQETRLARNDRIHRLARKEALWYLTVIAHEAMNPTSGPVSEVSPNTTGRPEMFGPAHEQITDILSALLVRYTSGLCHEERGAHSTQTCENELLDMDGTERGLIMGLVERAWLGEYRWNSPATVFNSKQLT